MLLILSLLLVNLTVSCAENSLVFFEEHKSELNNTEQLQAPFYLIKIQPIINRDDWQQCLSNRHAAYKTIEYISNNVEIRSHNVIPALLLNTPATDALVSIYLQEDEVAAPAALLKTLEEICNIKIPTTENKVVVRKIISTGIIPTEKIKKQTKNESLRRLLDIHNPYLLLTQE